MTKRQWVRCRECGRPGYYDYVPYSLSNPVMTLPCGHGAAQRFTDAAERITAKQAKELTTVEREHLTRSASAGEEKHG